MVDAFRWMVFVIGLAVVIGSIMVTSAQNPTIEIYSPSDGDTVYTDTITVSGGASRGEGGVVVESVTVNEDPVDGKTSWRKVISLQPGSNKITAVATDISGNRGTATISVTYYIEPTPTPTNGPSPTPSPTPTTIPNGGYRPTPTPTPPPTGSISITTIPSGAEVYWDGSFKGDTPITLDDIVGNHKIEISKEGYYSENRNIDLYERITKKLNIKLKQITGFIVVSSTPSGACVYLNGDYKGKTPKRISTVVGNHTIKLTKSDYFDRNKSVFVSASRTSYLHENLTGYGSINIFSYPSGAKVYLDGNDTRETTPTNISRVAVGNHTIKLTKFCYFNVTENVSVSVGRTHPVHENLTECCYINISSNPSGAKVYLDGVYMGETSKNIPVAQGNHSIELTKSDYFNETENVSVSVGETRHLRENLTGYGSLRISSYPSAKVYLDGVYKGITPLDISKVVEGSHSINLTKFGYVAVKEKIDVSVGKTELLDKTLSASTWWWTLIMVLSAIALIALEEVTRGFIRKRIIPFIRSIKEKYLFNWDRVPGDDDEIFKKSLRDYFDIWWAENEEICKSDDGKTISISKDENSAEIIIDAKKEKASLKITNVRTLNLKVKNENDKLNIYKKKNK